MSPLEADLPEIERIIARLRLREPVLSDPLSLTGLTYSTESAIELINATKDLAGAATLGGQIVGDLRITGSVPHTLMLRGQIIGDLTIAGTVDGDLHIASEIAGNLSVSGVVTGDLGLAPSASVGGRLALLGRVDGSVRIDSDIAASAAVESGVAKHLIFSGRVGGNLDIWGAVAGALNVRGNIQGDLQIAGELGSKVSIESDIAGSVLFRESTIANGDVLIKCRGAETVNVLGAISGNLSLIVEADNVNLLGRVDGSCYLSVRLTGHIVLTGSFGGDLVIRRNSDVAEYVRIDCVVSQDCVVHGRTPKLDLTGRFGGPVLIMTAGETLLASVRSAQFGGEVMIGDGVRIDQCNFKQCGDLDKLNLVGSNLFPGPGLLQDPEANPDELAGVYRDLRRNLEGRGNRAGASNFYRGEMDSRLRAATAHRRYVETLILGAYRMISGYGLSASRAAMSFIVVWLPTSLWLRLSGLYLDPDIPLEDEASMAECLLFTAKSMVGFLSPPAAALSPTQQWLQLLLRFAGPVLLAQVVLSVRERVAR